MLKKILARIRPIVLRLFGINIALSCRLYKFKEIRGKGVIIGSNTQICEGSWIAADSCGSRKQANLIISDGCEIGYNNHFFAVNNILLDQDVLTGNNVLITDSSHEYKNIEIPIREQQILSTSSVTIGRGTWIGENVSIICASVGRNCVIGANSVVTRDIPDYCVVVGNPGRIIKKFNLTESKWEKY